VAGKQLRPAARDTDIADERRYKLLAATTDEEDDRVIEAVREAKGSAVLSWIADGA
jgi:hypothetical protein